jgi:hypothetical protein
MSESSGPPSRPEGEAKYYIFHSLTGPPESRRYVCSDVNTGCCPCGKLVDPNTCCRHYNGVYENKCK